MTLPKVIYIAGYGRSGSTILDIILGNHPQILSTGELCHLPAYWNKRQFRCTCGSNYENCALWGDALPAEEEAASLSRKWEMLTQLPRLVAGSVPEDERMAYRNYQQTLFSNLAHLSGKSFVVDSSQSSWPVAGRSLALDTLAELDVYVVHLVRNGLDNMQSIVVHGSNRALEGQEVKVRTRFAAIRAALGWASANLWSSLLGYYVLNERYIRVHYENFILDPEAALQQIGNLCGFDAAPLVEQVRKKEGFRVGHMVGGNRVRLQNRIRLRRRVAAVRGRKLCWYHRFLFWMIGGGIYWRYGYGTPWKTDLPRAESRI